MDRQQDDQSKKESSIYVQKPNGEEVNVKEEVTVKNGSDDGRQTAATVPTQASGEVTDGEDA